MINYCIHRELEIRKLTEEGNAEPLAASQESAKDTTSAQFKYDGDEDIVGAEKGDGWDDFDFSDEEADELPKEAQKAATPDGPPRRGAKHKHEKLKLLNGEEMWIPHTQDVGHMTEDMLREKEHFFADLGSSSEAMQIRANMQSVSLRSDMEAFKAANPNCELEDFVRWYSPSDWIEEPGEKYAERLDSLKASHQETIRKEREQLESERKAKEEKMAAANSGNSQVGSPRVKKENASSESVGEGSEAKEKEKEKEEKPEEKRRDEGGETVMDNMEETGEEKKKQEEEQGKEKEKEKETEEEYEEDVAAIYRSWPLRDDTVGHLSPRMQLPGNIWRQKWKEAKPTPTSEQRLLFDHVAEAERVLTQLDTMPPSVFMEQILTVCFNCIYYSLQCLPCTKIDIIQAQIHNLHKVFLGTNVTDLSEEEGEVVSSAIAQVENLLSRATSLLLKFPEQYAMVTELLGDRGEIPLTTQEERSAAENLFGDHLEPDAREFIFRSRIPRPHLDSIPTGQRMYALLTQAEFRLVTAFSTCDEFA